MFTGIIEAVGEIKSIENQGHDIRLTISTGKLSMTDVALGDSIAVNGVCLTAVEFAQDEFSADVSVESMEKITLGVLKSGSKVNLEKAITPTTRLGGHLVSGHVDGVGQVLAKEPDARSIRFRLKAPAELAKYIAAKGSITIDGVSLTVNQVDGAEFDINIVPHTLAETTISDYKVGSKVNLEVDLLARYLERLMLGDKAAVSGQTLTEDFLKQHGFA